MKSIKTPNPYFPAILLSHPYSLSQPPMPSTWAFAYELPCVPGVGPPVPMQRPSTPTGESFRLGQHPNTKRKDRSYRYSRSFVIAIMNVFIPNAFCVQLPTHSNCFACIPMQLLHLFSTVRGVPRIPRQYPEQNPHLLCKVYCSLHALVAQV